MTTAERVEAISVLGKMLLIGDLPEVFKKEVMEKISALMKLLD